MKTKTEPAAPGEHDHADGCPEGSAEHWRDLYEAMGREATDQRTRASRLLQEQVKHDRDIYAAAKREAWDHALFNTNLYVKGEVTRELRGLAYRLANLPGKLQPNDVFFVRIEARDLLARIDAVDVEGPGSQLGEVHRLRAAINAQGRVLHDQYASDETRDAAGKCRCPGCELLREVELVEVSA